MGGLLRTTLLMGVLTGLLMLVGGIVGLVTDISMEYALTAALMMAIMLNFFMYFFADRWVLAMYRAKIVSPTEEPRLHQIVERLTAAAKLPKPKVAVVPLDVPNAFATGRSPSHSVVAVTKGALELLNDEELEGVLGHELAHVKNRDMLINTLAAIIGAAITYSLYFSLYAPRRSERDSRAGAIALLGFLLVPFAVMLVRLAISRGREYEADRGGANISGKPLALASALRKLESAARVKPLTLGNPSTSHLFIVNPFRGMKLLSLFSTHPPAEERIRRLEALAKS
ncbi:MAG: M48 family metalloprotease [Candidatus Hadarchaeales archaeon]